MRLLSLDYDPVYGDDDVTWKPFSSDESVFDHDVVIWDPARSFFSYDRNFPSEYMGLPSLSDSASVQMVADMQRRRQEFVEFVNSGRSLIIIVRPPQECYVDTGKRTHSGTGRNQKTTRHVEKVDLMSVVPANGVAFTKAGGTRLSATSNGAFTNLFKSYKDFIRYEAFIENAPGTTLAIVQGTQRVLASVQRSKGGGHLIMLPAIDLSARSETERDEDGWDPRAIEFQKDLLTAVEGLSGARVLARPQWASSFRTVEEQRLEKAVKEQTDIIESARSELAKRQQEREAAEAKSQLYVGTGRALELEVKASLELLGGTVTEPEAGRDDWKVEFPEGKAVVEVKGVGKSAAEKHAAQLEKWVSGELAETGQMPKGILIVNTWREIPLSDRTEKDFPDQMIPYSKSRSHVLITGLQLFTIRMQVEQDPSRASFWRGQIMGTDGVLEGCDGWREHIEEVETSQ